MKIEELALIERITYRHPETDPETVVEYTNLMKQGVEFPAVVLATWGKDNVALVDGVHRLCAAMNAKLTDLKVSKVAVKSRLEAELLAFKHNVAHGRLLTADEKRKACVTLLQAPAMAKLSNVKAAEKLGVSDMTVKRYRDALGTKSPKATQSGHKSATEPKVDKGGVVKPQGKPAASAWALNGGSWSGGGVEVIAQAVAERITEGVGRKSVGAWNARLDYLRKVAEALLAYADANKATE